MLKIGYMTITSEDDGVIMGPSVYKMAPDSIEVVDIEHELRQNVDAVHGVSSGDRQHTEFIIYKAVDFTSPILYKSLCNSSNLTEVKIQYYIQVGNQADPVPFFSWTLLDARITRVRQIPAKELGGPFADQYDLLETVQFVYQSVEWEHYAHRAPIGLKDLPNIMYQDAWSKV